MNALMHSDFLLTTPTARTLYHDYAAPLPLIDYHCHIDPAQILADRRFENMTRLWLEGDHYKWRILRACGVEEDYVTGNAPDREKFRRFAAVLPRCIGNPMYHWCHLELKNYFGYEGLLNADTADWVWDLCAEQLPALSARRLITKSKVAMIGTTDDPCNDLPAHAELAALGWQTLVCPTFRPDPALSPRKSGFAAYLGRLGEASGVEITTVSDLRTALSRRMDHFAAHGCRASDHGLDYIPFRLASEAELNAILADALGGKTVTPEQSDALQTALLLFCGGEYAKRGWVMQLHFSCMRNPNTAAFARLGPDSGFDSIAVTSSCAPLFALLDRLESQNALPRMVLYSLNPADNAWIDSLIGAFQGSGIPGKLQHGSAWWFNDHRIGMREQMTGLASMGVLGSFIGMLTDSRSLLSYTRHEYFRRILCELLGEWVERGEYPADTELLGGLVRDISCFNAARYFGIEIGAFL